MIHALRGHLLAVAAAVAVVLVAVLAISLPAAATPVPAATSAQSANLLGNPRGTTGDVSVQGWDEVTIPAGR